MRFKKYNYFVFCYAYCLFELNSILHGVFDQNILQGRGGGDGKNAPPIS